MVATSWCVAFPTSTLPATDDVFIENITLSGSDDEPSDVEILSPPQRRPVTRSISVKRVADEMEREALPSSPILQPPTKKARREATGHSTSLMSTCSTYCA
jgi:hypothetical protein